MASFIDGTSNTIGFAEVKAYTPYLRNGGNPAAPNTPPPTDPAVVAAFGGEFKADSGHTEWVDARVHQTGVTTCFPPNTKVPGHRAAAPFTTSTSTRMPRGADATAASPTPR